MARAHQSPWNLKRGLLYRDNLYRELQTTDVLDMHIIIRKPTCLMS